MKELKKEELLELNGGTSIIYLGPVVLPLAAYAINLNLQGAASYVRP